MITVKELIGHLQELPQDLVLMISSDDEGNSYRPLGYKPEIRYFDKRDKYQTESCYTPEDAISEELDMDEFEQRVLL